MFIFLMMILFVFSVIINLNGRGVGKMKLIIKDIVVKIGFLIVIVL